MDLLTDIFEFTTDGQVLMVTDSHFDRDDGATLQFLREQHFVDDESDEEKAEWMANTLKENAEASAVGDEDYDLYEQFKRMCDRAGIEYG